MFPQYPIFAIFLQLLNQLESTWVVHVLLLLRIGGPYHVSDIGDKYLVVQLLWQESGVSIMIQQLILVSRVIDIIVKKFPLLYGLWSAVVK